MGIGIASSLARGTARLDASLPKCSVALSCLLASALTGAAGCTAEESSVTDAGAAVDAGNNADGGSAGDGGGSTPPSLSLEEGKIEGKLSGNTRLFLGIPYAKPPVGELRFAAPQPVEPWTEMRSTKEFGPSCPQNSGGLSASGPQSEDCLSLNVYAPMDAKGLPVMVWIHGGANISGGSNQYDGTRLASEGPVVVVTLNYRLGALGWLSHPALDAVRGQLSSGNDALRDQQLALTWVKKNIAKFGGDPGNVTLMGESSGALSTCVHIVSPKSQDLAKRFILESGACVSGLPLHDKAKADGIGSELVSSLCAGEADPIACLRTKDSKQIIAWGAERGADGAGWWPVANAADDVLPAPPVSLIESNKHNKGELIIGSNKNEWALFLLLAPQSPVNTIPLMETALGVEFGATAAAAITAHYAPPDDGAANAMFVKAMTDGSFRCPARRVARALAAKGSKVYLYSFEQGPAMHAFEIPYVFGNPSPMLAPVLDEPTRAAVQGYWRTFAKNGEPAAADLPAWPAYAQDRDQHMILATTTMAGTALSAADCDFWDSLVSK